MDWFQITQCFSAEQGTFLSIPTGLVCKVDGTADEAYPLLTLDELLEQLKEPAFKKEFMLVRAGVEAANLIALRKEECSTESMIGLRMVRRVAFIHSAEFARIGAGELGTPHCTAPVLQLPSYCGTPGQLVEGTICELSEVPDGCFHEEVEAFMSTGRKHRVELLGPERTFRKGQVAERFQQSAIAMISKRPQSLKGAPGTAPRIAKYIKEYQDWCREQELQNKQTEQNQGVTAPLIISSHSFAEDDDGLAAGMGVLRGKNAKRGVPVATPARAAAAADSRGAGQGFTTPLPKQQRRSLRGTAAADAAFRALSGSVGSGGQPATPSASAAEASPSPRSYNPAPATPAFVAGRLTSAASVVDVSSSARGSLTGPAKKGEESIDVQRVLQGAKLGREMKTVILYILLYFALGAIP